MWWVMIHKSILSDLIVNSDAKLWIYGGTKVYSGQPSFLSMKVVARLRMES